MGAQPEVLVDAVRPHDLARVHAVVGIPDRLELGERPHELVAEHLREQLGARLSVAVLARQRTAVRHDEICGGFDERPVAPDALDVGEVEVDARVHATLAEVAVQRAAVPVLVEQLAEVAQVLAQSLGRHGRVLPPLPGRR